MRAATSALRELVKEKLEAADLVVVATSPEQFATHIESEMAKAAKIIRAANIKTD